MLDLFRRYLVGDNCGWLVVHLIFTFPLAWGVLGGLLLAVTA